MFNYEHEYRTFRLEMPEKFNFSYDVFDKWAQEPNKVALFWTSEDGDEKKFTFDELKRLSLHFSAYLKSLEINKGDRVLLMLPVVPEWWISMLGMLRLGVIAIPATTLLTPKDISYRIEAAEIKAVITDSENAGKVDEALSGTQTVKRLILIDGMRKGWDTYDSKASLPPIEKTETMSDEPALIYFTSGTTGPPKMVLHTHASYPLAHIVTGKYWLDLKPDDLHWTLSDTGWAKAAWCAFFGPWHMGSAIFTHHKRGKFDAHYCLGVLEKYRVTSFCAPPTAYRMMVLEDLKAFNLKNLRHCAAAGEPLNPEVIQKWRNGTERLIYDGYGQTETVNLLANFPSIPVKPGSMGRPVPGFYVSVIDDEGNELSPDIEGEIAVRVKPERPVGLFKEYVKKPAATEKCYRGNWYLTGDRAYKDEDGYFWFVGRADDIILSSGYRIGPFEVESALLEHPSVAEAAVVASPDEIRGEVVKAFVVLKRGFEPSDGLLKELQEHTKKTTAPYKYPRKIEFVHELPKTITGKIKRYELRKMEFERRT